MKIIFIILFSLIIGLCSCKKKDAAVAPVTTATVPTDTKGSLSGTISPATAVSNITLQLFTATGPGAIYSTTADAQGNFNFAALLQGNYVLTLTATSGYVSVNQPVIIVGGQNTALGDVSLRQMPGSINGMISPAGAATSVSLMSTSGGSTYYATPTGTGSFLFSFVAPGTYTLNFTAALGYVAPVSPAITVATAQNTDAGTLVFKAAAPGSISGSVSPAGSVAYVQAVYIGSATLRYTVVPDASGNFKINNVTPGSYYVTAASNAVNNLYAPYSRRIAVTEGQDISVGTIGLTTTPPPYPFSCTVDGTDGYSTLPGASYSPSKQTVSVSTTVNGNLVTVYAGDVTGPGNYTCNSTTSSFITYTVPPKISQIPEDNNRPYTIWSTKAGGNGSITITSIDVVNKTVSGSFSGSLGPSSSNATNMKTITKGAIVNVQYQ